MLTTLGTPFSPLDPVSIDETPLFFPFAALCVYVFTSNLGLRAHHPRNFVLTVSSDAKQLQVFALSCRNIMDGVDKFNMKLSTLRNKIAESATSAGKLKASVRSKRENAFKMAVDEAKTSFTAVADDFEAMLDSWFDD